MASNFDCKSLRLTAERAFKEELKSWCWTVTQLSTLLVPYLALIVSRLYYSTILLYRTSGDRDEYFDILIYCKFRYNQSSFVVTLCPAGLQIELRYKRNFDIIEFDIAGLCCSKYSALAPSFLC